jgi:tRNA dimethylallyltransferase
MNIIMKHKIIFIVGPTSSGKSRTAACLAEKINGEIISCDSMQVYMDMPVINQVPSDDILHRVKHYLIEEISPEDEFNAAKFAIKAVEYIEQIIDNGRMPIIAGGTGLYMKSLLDGLFDAPPKDESLRKTFEKIAEDKGNKFLHEKLQEVDPSAAAKLHINDLTRIIRALEVYEMTGRTISEKKDEAKGIYEDYDCKIFGLSMPRDKLYKRIEQTVDKMIASGLIDEVKELKEKKLSLTAQKALGIREMSEYLEGKTTLEEAVSELKKNTRRYAKRQMTWFNADERIEWIDADRETNEIVEEILNIM